MSFAGGPGRFCDITGENVEYARGGAGGVPRVYGYFYMNYASGVCKTNYTSSTSKVPSGCKGYTCEAKDGKPGRNGYGDGGGGSGQEGYTGSNPTFAGRGGSGAVIVRIPPYKTTVEDALKAAFADQPADVSGASVTLTDDVTGPIRIPDNLGAVSINLNGHAIIGANGAAGDDITPGGNGQAALAVVAQTYASEADAMTEISVTGTGSLKGGDGAAGYPGGAGASALSADGFPVSVASGISVSAGEAGESLVQHPHKWAYSVEDGKIIAYCVADDGEPCSYRDQSRGPVLAISAADAAYTAMRYDELSAVNGITPVTGIVIAPETYVGRGETVYPESSTPPREQGAYTVSMRLGDLRITSDFTITEPKPSQGSVYQAWKTAERKGRDVRIALSATFDGSKAINNGNVLFLGSRCSAHSMAKGTVESSVNALTRYANVRWYAYGLKDSAKNKINMLTKKGEKVSPETVALTGGNHFVHKEMMDDLYAELVEKRNRAAGYDLLILEFDGDLLCRDGYAPYQLNYRLPEGWTDEKAARLRAAMSRYYEEDRVVWIVPDVNQEKDDPGWTGEYPWTSNPEFIWQRAFLNATETEGYRCPLQKNYEDTDELVDYLQEVLVGHFFSNAIIKDTLADGLTIRKVTPQMRSDGGIWRNFEGGPSHYTIPEPRSKTTVKADVEQEGRQVTVTFDMKEEQAWACSHDQVIGDDFRVVIDAELDGFFSGSAGDGEWQETNEGPATFIFTESNLNDDEEDYTITIEKDSPKIQNVKLTPDYASEDVVRIYDGKGTNIVARPIAPTPGEAVIRYSLDEHGAYADGLALTNVCEKTKVWFEITDRNGDFTAVTNFATVTILPRVVVEQAGSAEKSYDGNPLAESDHTYIAARSAEEGEKMYPGQGAAAAGFVAGEGFANVPMTSDSQQTEVGSHANTIDEAAVTVNEKTDKDNYVFIYLPGTLTVTAATMGIAAFPAEKFYDAEGTNVTWVVTNAAGGVISDATVSLREKGTGPWIPAADFPPCVDTTNVTVEVKAEKAGFAPATAEAAVLVKPRPVTFVAGSASKTYDGLPLTDRTFAVKADTTTEGYGFVKEEGVASVTMTADSTITEPGVGDNVIDAAAVSLLEGTKPGNYIFHYLPGELKVIQRQEEVRRDPEVEIPEESREAVEESDKKTGKALDEMAKADQEATGKTYVKYQLTVTPTNRLGEATRTTPEKAAEAARRQIELAESGMGSKIDKVEFFDIVLERTYSKEEAEATAAGDYNKDNWDSIDRAEEHGNRILEVTIPVEVPEGMELAGVTRSCDNRGTEILRPRDPNDPDAEGFIHDPVTKTVTLYARDFCVFGFLMKKRGRPFNNLCERPLVYDFKASVKHMSLKEVKVSVGGGFTGTVYGKVRKAASLKGYLVVDRAGATSRAVVKGRGTDCNNIPASGTDYGRNRAFLVVQNSSVERSVRKPKVLPAVLDAKRMDTAFARARAASSGLAEGYLHIGGDSVACVRPQLDRFGAVTVERIAAPQPPSAGVPGMTMPADYAWTSAYLFGRYNGPSWYTGGALSQCEQAINAAQPPDLQIRSGGVPVTPYPFYHDTWMGCAGFGRYFVPPAGNEKTCCGAASSTPCGALPAEPVLSSLAGTLKGGLFLCSENGIVATDGRYVTFDGGVWEDQFATARLVPAGTFAPDAFQADLWQDGAVAQETTDILYGNWSIKIRQNFIPDAQIADQGAKALLTNAEMDALASGANARASGLTAATYPLEHHVEAATGLYMLAGTLKAAVLKLDRTATFVETASAGKEIYSKPANARLDVPAITPKFAQYFGLANWW